MTACISGNAGSVPNFLGEFVLAEIVAFLAFVVLGASQLDTSGRGWKGMYNQGVIDKREYYENRFRII